MYSDLIIKERTPRMAVPLKKLTVADLKNCTLSVEPRSFVTISSKSRL